MITTKTANEIVARTKRMEDTEYCLADLKKITGGDLIVSLREEISNTEGEMKRFYTDKKRIDIDLKLLEIFLGNIRDYEKANLDELNYLAVQEAQG